MKRAIILGVTCVFLLAAGPATAADPAPAPPTVDQLPSIHQLPDPFLFPDGSRVASAADWDRRRRQIEDLVLTYEYGHPAPSPGNVQIGPDAPKIHPLPDSGGTEQEFILTMGPQGKISTRVVLTLPDGKGPFPVIIKGDLCWGRVNPKIVSEILHRGYALAEFDRTMVAADDQHKRTGVLAAYPEADGGELLGWAWGFWRVIDYLQTLPQIDKDRIIVTGHSRGGKAALLAGALDSRVALTVPNGSGSGGCGCFRIQPPGAETLDKAETNSSYWYSPRFRQFIGHADQLPFDQHEVRALVAPRALLSTDALADAGANGPGTQATYLAAREVYTFLGVPDKIGIHYRQGKHDQNLEDFVALLDFADQVLLGKPAVQDFHKLPFPDEGRPYAWIAPKSQNR